MEPDGGFPASFQDAKFCGRSFPPQCGWVISDATLEENAQLPDFPVSHAEPAYLKTVWLRIG
jgi:hypothetical protein